MKRTESEMVYHHQLTEIEKEKAQLKQHYESTIQDLEAEKDSAKAQELKNKIHYESKLKELEERHEQEIQSLASKLAEQVASEAQVKADLSRCKQDLADFKRRDTERFQEHQELERIQTKSETASEEVTSPDMPPTVNPLEVCVCVCVCVPVCACGGVLYTYSMCR